MRILLTAALLIASVGAASARTIKETVALALKSGADESIGTPLATNLGYPGPTRGKILSYSLKRTPDGREHQFNLIFDQNGEPASIVWGNTLARREADERTFVDGWKFRTDLKGKLVSAVHSPGYAGEIVQEILDLSKSETTKAYKNEREFILTKASSIEFSRR